MTLEIPEQLLVEIRAHGEAAYPEEGAGLLLGELDGERRRVVALVKLPNRREATARHYRYALVPEDYLQGEQEAARLGLDLIGIFHSHPDHPDLPSEFDREWAWPTFAYLITSVHSGRASGSRAWLLKEDRSGFLEEPLASTVNHY
jgi:proteasome lid subunit RPN8/RPN11